MEPQDIQWRVPFVDIPLSGLDISPCSLRTVAEDDNSRTQPHVVTQEMSVFSPHSIEPNHVSNAATVKLLRSRHTNKTVQRTALGPPIHTSPALIFDTLVLDHPSARSICSSPSSCDTSPTPTLLSPSCDTRVNDHQTKKNSSAVHHNFTRVTKSTLKFITRLRGVWFHKIIPPDIVDSINQIVAEQSDSTVHAAAELAADMFIIPREAIVSCESDLEQLGSLPELIASRQRLHAPLRFNKNRCFDWFSDDVEYNKLSEIATSGAVIDLNPNFVSTSSPEERRPLVLKLQHTFAKHAYELWRKGQALLLTLQSAVSAGVHFSPVHWTAKPGKPEGRFLCDLSNADSGFVINDKSVKALIEERYGPVVLPDIHDIVNNIFILAERSGGLENIVLWKEDIVGAFNQWNFNPSSARYLAFHIEDNTVLILFTGVFGWTGSPAVWAVFSRALLRAAAGRIQGLIIVYVDDFIGISTSWEAKKDQALLQELIFGVFGPSAINLEKSVSPCRGCDCIGWFLDLIYSRMYPNEKGRIKLLATFFSVDLSKKIPQKMWQKLASLAERYSRGIIGARAFVRPLHAAAAAMGSQYVTSETKMCIAMWRALALLGFIDPLAMAVPLSWIMTLKAVYDYFVTTDAGPLGLGIVVRDKSGKIVAFASYRFPFEGKSPAGDKVKESRFQNVREFMGAILALIVINLMDFKFSNIMWINDNVSALAWVEKDMSSSTAARWSFLAFSWLSILGHVRIGEVKHIPGVDMGVVDDLSRFIETPSLSGFPDWSLRLPVDVLNRLFSACNPSIASDTSSSGEIVFDSWESNIIEVTSLVKECLISL